MHSNQLLRGDNKDHTYGIGPEYRVLYPSNLLAKGMKFHRKSINYQDEDVYKFAVELEY